MIYCVVPRELSEELYPKLTEHYAHEDNVTVIVDRRQSDRRGRGARASDATDRPIGDQMRSPIGQPGSSIGQQQRVLRDRRRARMPGDLPPLARAL